MKIRELVPEVQAERRKERIAVAKKLLSERLHEIEAAEDALQELRESYNELADKDITDIKAIGTANVGMFYEAQWRR